MALRRIADLLQHSLNLHGAAQGVAAAQVVDAANTVLAEVFGPDITKDLHARAYIKKEVYVAFTDAMAASEIRNRQAELLARMSEKLPRVSIKGFRTVPATDLPLSSGSH